MKGVIMINDASISDIILSLKQSQQKKLQRDQKEMKTKIIAQFKKLSKEELLNRTIEEVYSVIIYNKKSSPLSEITLVPKFQDPIMSYLYRLLKEFYNETSIIDEDGFNLMTYFEFLLNQYDSNYLYWCSYPQISYDIIEEAETYYFTLVKFNTLDYKKNLYFGNELHPFVKALNYTWISQFKESSYDNIFRKAASNMNDLLEGIWDHINLLSTLKYEGSQNNGSILFAMDKEPTLLLTLTAPVPLSHYRQIRKLLQISYKEHNLIIDSNYMAIGYGYIKGDEPIYRLDFLDHLSWKLYYGKEEFLSCLNLIPLLPTASNNIAMLRDKLSETFSHTDFNKELLTDIIEEAKFQKKGTMIVISPKAKEEAIRLKTSALSINPIQFTKSQIKKVTAIDGAIILDTKGYCHSIGCILDGYSNDNGDSSRGARYNSAIRYLNSQKSKNIACLIAVISEDRYIDILTT